MKQLFAVLVGVLAVLLLGKLTKPHERDQHPRGRDGVLTSLAAAKADEDSWTNKAKATGQKLAEASKREGTLLAAIGDDGTPQERLADLRDDLGRAQTYRKSLALQMMAELRRARGAVKQVDLLMTELVLLDTHDALNTNTRPASDEGGLDLVERGLNELGVRVNLDVDVNSTVEQLVKLFDRFIRGRKK